METWFPWLHLQHPLRPSDALQHDPVQPVHHRREVKKLNTSSSAPCRLLTTTVSKPDTIKAGFHSKSLDMTPMSILYWFQNNTFFPKPPFSSKKKTKFSSHLMVDASTSGETIEVTIEFIVLNDTLGH